MESETQPSYTSPSYYPLKAVLYFSAVFHILAGLYIVFSGDESASYGEMVFGMTVTPNASTLYVLKAAGIYAVAFGAVVWLAARDPQKYKTVIYIVIGLYAFRCLNRLLSFKQIQEDFAVTPFRSWLAISILGFITLMLFVFRPKKL